MAEQQKINWVKYALLPGIISRILALFTSGFSTSAYTIALIYHAVRLLPANHPYLKQENIGKYGIRHVIGEAANNLVIKPQNIDQIIIFFGILTGMVVLLSQIFLMVGVILTYQPAIAQTATEIFKRTPDQNLQDIAMILLDRVFGIAGIFESCISVTSTECTDMRGFPVPTPTSYPFPFHLAFHQLLKFYSFGLFFIGLFIILYFVVVVISETAASGSPFGQRYNKTWVPVRMILFFALLIPIGAGNQAGLNAAQLITLRIAKGGSNMASNAWEKFNKDLTDGQLVGKTELIAIPNLPEIDELVKFMFLTKTCKITEESLRPEIEDETGTMRKFHGPDGVQAYLVRNPPQFTKSGTTEDTLKFRETSFADAISHTDNGRIQLRFGSHITDETHPYFDRHDPMMGKVRETCGGLTFNITTNSQPSSAAYKIQDEYYKMIKALWENTDITEHADCLFQQNTSSIRNVDTSCTKNPDTEFMTDLIKTTTSDIAQEIAELIKAESSNTGQWDISAQLKEKGWAGAGIWYNRIAEMNGAVTGAMFNIPTVHSYPFVMEFVALKKKKEEENPNPVTIFEPIIKGQEHVNFADPKGKEAADIIYIAYERFNIQSDYTGRVRNGNLFLDMIDLIFGTSGLYDILNNPDVNPLAQLSALGKGMMDSALRNAAFGTAGSLLGKVFGKVPVVGQGLSVSGGFAKSVGYAVLGISFILYYILPLMPFIYFFFAVIGWIKGIFEAMVAMPLWALSHIVRWDGEGLPGPAASGGYILLFEIFLRPILILFGLLASISIFSGMVMVLNEIFQVAVGNIGGFNQAGEAGGLITDLQNLARGPVDELFFTILYTVICYVMGTSCFKLIDQIPNEILRYMNFSVKTFQETTKNAADELSQKTYRGTNFLSARLSGDKLSDAQKLSNL